MKSGNLGALFFIALCLCSGALGEEEKKGKSWVLLVAGSKYWYNYRHQADVCHSYQIVKAHGIPDENIVVMMYDDLAFNHVNPTPGKIINKPNGKNVYPGVPKDYVGKDVTPVVFLDVLSGVKPSVGSGKFINSTSEDNVFVYFTDHGGPGILAFPDDVLSVKDLNKTIHKMERANRFKKLVFYIEACESGSMFDGILSQKGNIYAMTASDPEESSYACYYSKKYDTYLGDVYSVNWLEDADKENLKKESIKKQYEIVKKETNTSTVCQYGDLKLSEFHLSEFLGSKAGTFETPSDASPLTPMSSRDVPQDLVQRKGNPALTRFTQAKRKFMEDVFHQIMSGIVFQRELTAVKTEKLLVKETNQDCYFEAVDAIHEKCFNMGQHSYALQFLQYFVNICSRTSKEKVLYSISKACKHLSTDFTTIVPAEATSPENGWR